MNSPLRIFGIDLAADWTIDGRLTVDFQRYITAALNFALNDKRPSII